MDDSVIRDRIDRHRLLGKSEEELASVFGPSPVESERELIKVVVEVLLADSSSSISPFPSPGLSVCVE